MAMTMFASAQQNNPRPNIILILGDDMRYDSFQPNGGPSWFMTPSINRIAEEGVNFQYFFCTYSLCVPARSSIVTGLYPHSSGAYGNFENYFMDLPTFATILDNAGYHTGMIGKYHVYVPQLPEWDYWLSKADDVDYSDALFNLNGVLQTIPGNPTQIINDSVHHYLANIDTPFVLFIGHQAPHKPVIPLPQHKGMYNGLTELPVNYHHYDLPYPSFNYSREYYSNPNLLLNDLEKYYEGIMGIEENVADIFELLAERKILDNTMILFSSDNGALYGDHQLAGKGLAYEPSIRLPLFIRYPAWFQAGSVVTDQMGANIDIAPTIVEAAGLDPGAFGFQGFSLRKLYAGESARNQFLYENIKIEYPGDGDTADVPSLRSIRTFYYKFTRASCESGTEELFDLVNDPHENHNLALDSSYLPILNSLRYSLDSLKAALSDTLASDTTLRDCYLVINPDTSGPPPDKSSSITFFTLDSPSISLHTASLFAGGRLAADEPRPVGVTFFNTLGQVIYRKEFPPGMYLQSVIKAAAIPEGICFVQWQERGLIRTVACYKSYR